MITELNRSEFLERELRNSCCAFCMARFIQMLNETHRPCVSFFLYEVAITGRKRLIALLARLPFSFNHLLALTNFAGKAAVGRLGE